MKLHFAKEAMIPLAMAALPWMATAQAIRSIWDGVYTEEQALLGKNVYAQQCAACHGADLAGGASGGDVAPPLAGTEFMTGWDARTLGDLFDRIRTSMPQDSPGSLSGRQTADVVAFLLTANKIPAGTSQLATDATTFKSIKIEVKKGSP